MSRLFAAPIMTKALACILGCFALIAAPSARADECRGSGDDRICLHRLGPGGHYVQFYFSIARGGYSHFNVRLGATQWEVPAVGGRSNRSRGTQIQRRAGNEYNVSAQACMRRSPGWSFCSPWQVFTVSMDTSGGQDTPDSKNSWAAIASDSKGRWGWAHSERSETGARTKAVGACGPGCKVTNTARNRCLAYAESRDAQSRYWLGTSIGPSLPYVTTHALQACSSDSSTCRIVHSVCGD
jgi:uncharacterized protein DUF4189